MSDDVLTKVRQIFKKVFDVDPRSVLLETNSFDIPGWDSIGQLSLGGALEEAFGVQLDISDLSEMGSVSAIISIIAAKKR